MSSRDVTHSSFLCQWRGWILRGLKYRFGFDGWGWLFGLGDSGAAVGTDTVARQLTNQNLLVAFSVGGRNYFQTDNWGTHCLTENFLGSRRMRERRRRRKRKRERETGRKF